MASATSTPVTVGDAVARLVHARADLLAALTASEATLQREKARLQHELGELEAASAAAVAAHVVAQSDMTALLDKANAAQADRERYAVLA